MAATGPPPQRKLTKAERKKADAELKRRMPSLAAVSRNGVFETVGQLYSTHAVGQIPGGRFIPTRMVAKGHNLYLFDGASPPSAKPRSFLNVKRAEVVEVGLLLNPPLPPHTNVMRINLLAKQFGHKSWFFKTETNKELQRWLTDLRWRTHASEAAIERRFEPAMGPPPPRRRLDETETAIDRAPESVVGMVVRYAPREVVEVNDDIDEEDALGALRRS